jgi:hypothetical protein
MAAPPWQIFWALSLFTAISLMSLESHSTFPCALQERLCFPGPSLSRYASICGHFQEPTLETNITTTTSPSLRSMLSHDPPFLRRKSVLRNTTPDFDTRLHLTNALARSRVPLASRDITHLCQSGLCTLRSTVRRYGISNRSQCPMNQRLWMNFLRNLSG